jgi:transposase
VRRPSKRGVDQAIGRSRGGLTTKIHVIVDALGNPLALRLTGGQVHDITQAEALAAEAQPEALLGDKGYDADAFIESLEVRAIKPVIPPKSNRKVARDCDFALYAERRPAFGLRPRWAQMRTRPSAPEPAQGDPRPHPDILSSSIRIAHVIAP